MADCSVDKCAQTAAARGWCPTHYMRWRRTGDPEGSTRPSDAERFASFVAEPDENGCMVWLGSTWDGYGLFTADGHQVKAHRWAYEHEVGPIPDGLVLDHVRARGCCSRACVNVAHLEPVTRRENTLRGDTVNAANLAKTHCPRSHPLDEVNTYRHPDGRRECLTCKRKRNRERMRQLRAAAKVTGGLP